MRDIGRMIKGMGKEFFILTLVINMMEIIKMIKEKGEGYITIGMVIYI